jgi:hypothetical protein
MQEFELKLQSGDTLWVGVQRKGDPGGGLPGVEVAVHTQDGGCRLPTDREFALALPWLFLNLQPHKD